MKTLALTCRVVDVRRRLVVLDHWPPPPMDGLTDDAIETRFMQPGKGGTSDSGYRLGVVYEVLVFE